MNMNDTQLIRQYAKDGDHAAFEELVKRYVDVAYAAAMIRLGRDDLARDACQTTFLALAEKAAKLSPDINLGGWIYSTARNTARKIQRTEIRRMQREQTYVDHMKTQSINDADWSRLGPDIHDALDRLKAPERDAIILRFFQHKSLSETGTILGITTDAARMRIKRALERLNTQLVRKGITSTTAALAAALPAHAALTAPTGLAASISTTVLAGAGTVITSATLTGAAVIAMKAKALIITAAAAAVVGSGVYIATRPDEDTNPSRPAQEAEDSRPGLNARHVHASDSDQEMGASDRLMPSDDATPARTAMAPPNNILPEQLKKAEQLFAMIKAAKPIIESSPNLGQGDRIIKDGEDLARKLELRLNVGEEQAAAFHDILAAHANENAHRMEAAMQEANRKLSEFLDMDQETAVTLLALEMMKDEGHPLTPEQEAYYQAYSEQYGTGFGQGHDPSAGLFERWYDNADVLAALEAELDPAQQAELMTYVEEQKLREQEQQIYHRTNQLANQLGLNEADRQALYDYLNQYPEATLEDIAAELTPELRDLLLKKTSLNQQD